MFLSKVKEMCLVRIPGKTETFRHMTKPKLISSLHLNFRNSDTFRHMTKCFVMTKSSCDIVSYFVPSEDKFLKLSTIFVYNMTTRNIFLLKEKNLFLKSRIKKMSSPNEKKQGGRPQSEVWQHFERIPLKSAGHFSAKCTYCEKYWSRGTPNELEVHLANNCKEAPEPIRSYYLDAVCARSFEKEDAFSNKKRKTQNSNQRELTEWYDSTTLPTSKISSITRSLARAFICCGIPFSIIQNPFFLEFLYEMRPGYEPPTDELLSGRLLSEETSRINKKVDKIIKESNNLTLGIKYLSCINQNIDFINYVKF